ncbi:TolB family protein [Tepidibacter aestuarii]|uniref:TolB family protein n=1 Tax=Tepidibacter aestuarii TaxID=2925782 RepID=UPI0020BDF536|nr:hypothetical protein [Tepidibacter aestuarii]CAH2214550.1 conserved exported protein of unknown function [Tepidibacter aestuarii]
MIRKKLIAVMMSMVCMVSVVGCISKTEEEPKKNITVLENKNETVYNEVALKKIDQYEGVRISDWLNEDTIIMTKDNKNLKTIQTESGDMYPQNLHLYELNNKNEKLLVGEDYHHSNGIFSPDKKHIFYVQALETFGTGFIVDAEGKNKVKVTQNEGISFGEGRWVDNNQVIFATNNRKVCLADVNGKVTELLTSSDGQFIDKPIKIGSKVYYLSAWNLMVFDMDTKETKQLQEGIWDIVLSPDKTQFMMVKNLGEKRQLMLTDLEGNEKYTLAEGTQIFGTSWSPDQSKVAYTIMTMENGQKGLFIADIKTKKITQISADIDQIADQIKWSPSSKKLAVSSVKRKENKNTCVTYVTTLK